MPMSTIQHSTTNIHHSFHRFSKLVCLPQVLRSANIHKKRGVAVSALFEWLLTTIFSRYSLFRADPSHDFTTRTVRNCLNDSRTNWQRLVSLVALHLIQYIQKFTDQRRRQAFIIDDSLFKREFAKKTELLSKVFDHDKQCYLKGFRALTLGWSDGNTFLPVNFALMSSRNKKNQLGLFKQYDRRSLAAKRRNQAQRKMNDVAVELVSDAVTAGIQAQYALFDSWYSSPKMFQALRKLGLHSVGMLKRSKKVYFRYRNRQMNVKTLFDRLKREKRTPRANYLYSPIVKFEVDGIELPVKLVYVVNRHDSNQFLVLASTNIGLRPEEIIQLYGRRWQIEGYFKVAKQYLQFDKTQIQSYDGLCGHLAMVQLSYDLLALEQREAIDDRTLGDLFFDYSRPLPDIIVSQALAWLMKALSGIGSKLGITEDILNDVFQTFMTTLPTNLAKLIGSTV